MTWNHGNGKKSRYTAKITVITAIVNSWFSYSPSYHMNTQTWSYYRLGSAAKTPEQTFWRWFLEAGCLHVTQTGVITRSCNATALSLLVGILQGSVLNLLLFSPTAPFTLAICRQYTQHKHYHWMLLTQRSTIQSFNSHIMVPDFRWGPLKHQRNYRN